MKNILLLGILLASCFLVLCVQELLPAAWGFGGARVQFVPLLFCFGALLLPFPLALLWALGCGVLFDLAQLQILTGQPEIALGVSALFFLLAATVCHGVRPLFLHGKWWLLSLLAFASTIGLLALQYVLISMRRFESGGLFWSEEVFLRLIFPSILSALLAPLLVLLYYALGGRMRPAARDTLFH